ncbi:hypothetical protein AMS58_04690 [Pseudoalteromonas porphyrae]|uniref:Iron transporter n=2 Tax=Pseudoalteromonas TaxID=53246 RepID=A0A0N1EPN3_9GAMM|nr:MULTISPECIES: hypothetical protein [Pseudoalteromonas]KPH63510.1 hypothetical protein ADS77_09565 [Pseudoalteromonas porphyrae]KPH95973.1 hypothetical protein AMS58_04690 [Pseudoalteromonas porphyrae]NMR25688.1 iron transporter [Pseudoalteromonas sp. NEC-BIFX-2020_015]NNG41390.1 iron transporter [Pseudoalteromonas sp. NEC-BIFX-2020_002]
MNLTTKHLAALNITCRVLIALVGGYVLAALSAILVALLLPGDIINSIVSALMLSFIIYTVTVLYVFATKTTLRAGISVFALCILMYCFVRHLNGIAVL